LLHARNILAYGARTRRREAAPAPVDAAPHADRENARARALIVSRRWLLLRMRYKDASSSVGVNPRSVSVIDSTRPVQ
jgi:hypothetical protein